MPTPARVLAAVQRQGPAPEVAALEQEQVVAPAVVGDGAAQLLPAADNIGDKPSVGGSFGPQRAGPLATEAEEAAGQRMDTDIAAGVAAVDNMPLRAGDAATYCNAAADGDDVLS